MTFNEKLVQTFLNNQTQDGFFSEASELLNDAIGFKLLTFLVLDPHQKFLARTYSSNEEIYPIGGMKDVEDDYLTDLTIHRQESFIGNNRAEIEKYYPDHRAITSLGCESILNQVVVFDRKTIGLVNLLNEEDYFRKHHLEKTGLFARFVSPFFLNQQLTLLKP